MHESKIDATDRLRREGRWATASLYKDEANKRLRSEGRKADANDSICSVPFGTSLKKAIVRLGFGG